MSTLYGISAAPQFYPCRVTIARLASVRSAGVVVLRCGFFVWIALVLIQVKSAWSESLQIREKFAFFKKIFCKMQTWVTMATCRRREGFKPEAKQASQNMPIWTPTEQKYIFQLTCCTSCPFSWWTYSFLKDLHLHRRLSCPFTLHLLLVHTFTQGQKTASSPFKKKKQKTFRSLS